MFFKKEKGNSTKYAVDTMSRDIESCHSHVLYQPRVAILFIEKISIVYDIDVV